MITRKEIKEMLPRGKQLEIAKKAGVSLTSVNKFLSGTTKKSAVIERAALEVLLEHQKRVHPLMTELKELLH